MTTTHEAQERRIDFSLALDRFVEGVEKLHKGAEVEAVITTMRGPRYTRVVAERWSQKSVYCFIDNETGDVLKAANWKAPAKHARGNIFDDSNGLAGCSWTGPAYLK
jgi:hypothetical protein